MALNQAFRGICSVSFFLRNSISRSRIHRFRRNQNIKLTSTSTGASKEYTVTALNGRTVSRRFCAECGSPVFLKASVWPNMIGMWAGSLDDPIWYRPQAAIWVASAQPWDAVNPAIRQFRQGPEEDFLNELHLPEVPPGENGQE